MRRSLGLVLLFTLTFGMVPAGAVKDIAIDPDSGKVEILREDPTPESTAKKDEAADCAEARRRVAELEEAVRKLKTLVLKQRRKIRRQQEEIDRQDHVIQGLDQLLRRQ